MFGDAEGQVHDDLRSAIKRIHDISGIRVTPHDLRRTFASIASKLDISSYKVKALTNHLSGRDVTADYVGIEFDDIREAIQRIEDHVFRAEE